MSDDGSTAVEKKGRGRAKANGTQSEAKGDTKKRGRPPAATRTKESTKSSDDEQAPVAKRGRGRPKGSKKKAAAKGKSAPVEGRGRGRPRKDPVKDAASTDEEQDEDYEDEGSEEQ
ncbi:high mobility group protein HMG-I/HMG-Y-like [Spodoptera litura]|uniref:High mobility group protein HMG-I/HMG-Y-like n=1 Tax=Spodoptera litura TaxID=69820 RepID=A0A9J7IMJ5_SPOLT|nr:high mobility group protein HMG-I/HMG-Y-like [Spodoptera litura]XP_022816515.1 high mobility group protein HMG-I/HMG-Y-like [Spodoptera litura]